MDSCSQSPSIESFSYSWLVNLKPSLEFFESPNGSFRAYLDASSDEASSFIEMDPKLSPSKRFFVVHQDFNFDFPTLQSPLSNLVHADELISNGFLIPLFVKPLDVDTDIDRYESSSDSVSVPSTPLSSPAEENVSLFRKIRSTSMPGRYKRFPKRIFLKYLGFVRPLWLIIRGRRSNARVHVMKSWENENSPAASPRSSLASCPADIDIRRLSYDSESSIHEAVLHCKRTIGSK